MERFNLILITTPTQYKFIHNMFDVYYKRKLDSCFKEYVISKQFMTMINFHMFICYLKAKEYQEIECFKNEMFEELSLYKTKLFFEFIVDDGNKVIQINKVIYNEKIDRMGLIIKKSIMRIFDKYGFKLKLDEDFSKLTKKSFFLFAG